MLKLFYTVIYCFIPFIFLLTDYCIPFRVTSIRWTAITFDKVSLKIMTRESEKQRVAWSIKIEDKQNANENKELYNSAMLYGTSTFTFTFIYIQD